MRYNPYKEMVNTRNLYRFEDRHFSTATLSSEHYLVKQRSLEKLTRLAQRIWNDYNTNPRKKMPDVKFGKGCYYNGVYYSWTDGETIELMRGQRDIITIIHEMAHVLGHTHHNKKFVQLYIELLTKYTRVSKQKLLEGLLEHNVNF